MTPCTVVVALSLMAAPVEPLDAGTLASHFTQVTFERRDGSRAWKTSELARSVTWTAGPKEKGREAQYCSRDSLRRLVVGVSEVGRSTWDLLRVGRPEVRRLSGNFGVEHRNDFTCDVHLEQLRGDSVVLLDAETGEERLVLPKICASFALDRERRVVDLCDGQLLTLELSTATSRPPTAAERAAFEARRLNPPAVAGLICQGAQPAGRFVLTRCFRGTAFFDALWDPASSTLSVLQDTALTLEADQLSGPLVAQGPQFSRWFDEKTARLLVPDDGPLRWKTDRDRRRRDALQPVAGGFELRRYDLDAAQYEVLKRYRADECSGLLTLGFAHVDERAVAVFCVAPTRRNPMVATLTWSELLDLRRNTVWRTPLELRAVADDGTVVLTDLTRFDQLGAFGRVWLGQLPTEPARRP
jgi:hypothetical protein